jgi:beta-lactamase superfamily II metal-dependent hydrolase
MSSLVVLDVGHGSSAVLAAEGSVAVMDAGPGPTLLQYLLDQNIAVVDLVLISHGDADHVAGLVAVLSSPAISVRTIYINPDATKDSDSWLELRLALGDAATRAGVSVQVGLTTAHGPFLIGDTEIEILAPDPVTAMSAVGGTTVSGIQLTSNSMSAVFGISRDGEREVVLFGDLDRRGFDILTARGVDLKAEVVGFPHHGGRAGTNNHRKFASDLIAATGAETVLMSIGRERYQNPRPDVVLGIRDARRDAYIACTQLSTRCAANLPAAEPPHLSPLPARGREGRQCCAGTTALEFGAGRTVAPIRAQHLDFVRSNAPSALCQAP